MHASGDYLPAGVRGGGLPAWTWADRSVDDADIVLWYTLGLTHRVRPEDYPLMPVHTASFSLVPFGFFTENPALDVAAPGAGR
jgi:primary-amine oxidase